MLIERRSMISGQVHSMDLPIAESQIIAYNNGELIQCAFPNLTPEQREFIKTGITPKEWAEAFPEGEDV